MSWEVSNFEDACRRAAGRRAYNRRRRLERARRICVLLALLDGEPDMTGRELAARLGVHEATISRDQRFVAQVRETFRLTVAGLGGGLDRAAFRASCFSWLLDGRGWGVCFEMRNGARVR